MGADQFLAEDRVVKDTSPACQIDEVVEFLPETGLLAERGGPAFESQGAHGHHPPVAGISNHQVGVGGRLVEEHLVEL